MEKLSALVHSAAKQAIQKMIRNEASEWPPDCRGFYYQPHRPDTPLAEAVKSEWEKA